MYLYACAVFAVILVGALVYATIRIMEWYSKEPIIRYEIDVPSPPDNGRALEKPSIKVKPPTEENSPDHG